jgi:hypothetical protein
VATSEALNLDAQVRAVFDFDRPPLAQRRDHGLLD